MQCFRRLSLSKAAPTLAGLVGFTINRKFLVLLLSNVAGRRTAFAEVAYRSFKTILPMNSIFVASVVTF